jgi:hypothetical protein
MTYAEKLKDPRWQKKRLEIFERDGFTCQECESKDKQLHVHHRMYLAKKQPWDHPNELLVTVCFECHELLTEVKKSIERVLSGFDFGSLLALAEFLEHTRACLPNHDWNTWLTYLYRLPIAGKKSKELMCHEARLTKAFLNQLISFQSSGREILSTHTQESGTVKDCPGHLQPSHD